MKLSKRTKDVIVGSICSILITMLIIISYNVGFDAGKGTIDDNDNNVEPIWDIQIVGCIPSDKDVTVTVYEKKCEIYGSRADLTDNTPGDAVVVVLISIINANNGNGFIVATHGGYSMVTEEAAGLTLPLLLSSKTNPQHPDISWSNEYGDGTYVDSSAVYYDTIWTQKLLTVVVNINDAVYGGLKVGEIYYFVLLVGNQTLTFLIHPQ